MLSLKLNVTSKKLTNFKFEDIANTFKLFSKNNHVPTDITVTGAGGVVVIVVGNGHGDTSLNPGLDWLHFT